MKYCPQCSRDYDDETVFCAVDGSRLQVKSQRPGGKALAGLGAKGLGDGSVILSSQPISALGAASLQVPTPPKGNETFRTPRKSVPRAPAGRTPTPLGNAAQAVVSLVEPEPLDPSELTMRQPAVSTEMRAVGAPAAEDDLLEQPTVAMKTPVKTEAESDTPSLVGTVVAGRYRILRRLGEGGMGVVYEAVDDRLEKHVAVKVLREDFARRQDVVARFTQEAKSAARIKHENVLDVTDYGQTEDGSFFIAMELLVGTDLADVLQSEGTLTQERGVEVALQVCRALHAAHQKGIVHRDMKPENIFLVRADDGREVVKIVDFGIAQMKDISGSTEGSRKLTRTGMIFGTPEYMSPEQAAGKPIDHRVDVYAAGVILYEMFAGRVPFVGDSFMGILTQHMFEQPPKINAVNPRAVVSPELEAVIFKALAKDPAQRYQSMQEFADDLLRVRSGARTQAFASPPSVPVVPPGAAQVLGIQSTPGAHLPAPVTEVFESATAVVSRTVESELTRPPRKRVVVAVALVLGLVFLAGIATATWIFSHGSGASPVLPEPTVPRRGSSRPPLRSTSTAATSTVPSPVASPTAPSPVASPTAPRVPTTSAANTGALPSPARISIRVLSQGFTARTISFQYVTPPPGAAEIPACQSGEDCRRQVLAGVPLQITAQNGRRVGTMVVTPTREGEEFRVAVSPRGARPSSPGGNDRPSTGSSPSRPCTRFNPVTRLMEVCFD
jgi:serine/threonine-protein kinase